MSPARIWSRVQCSTAFVKWFYTEHWTVYNCSLCCVKFIRTSNSTNIFDRISNESFPLYNWTEYSVGECGGWVLCQTHFVEFVNNSTQFQQTFDVAMNAKCGIAFISGQCVCMSAGVWPTISSINCSECMRCWWKWKYSTPSEYHANYFMASGIIERWNKCLPALCDQMTMHAQSVIRIMQPNKCQSQHNKNVALNQKCWTLFALNVAWKKCEWLRFEKRNSLWNASNEIAFSGGKFESFSEKTIILYEVTQY